MHKISKSILLFLTNLLIYNSRYQGSCAGFGSFREVVLILVLSRKLAVIY